MFISTLDKLGYLLYATYLSLVLGGFILLVTRRSPARYSGLVMLAAGLICTAALTWMSSRTWGAGSEELIALRLRDLLDLALNILGPCFGGFLIAAAIITAGQKLAATGHQALGLLVPGAAIVAVFLTTTPGLVSLTERTRPASADLESGAIEIQQDYRVEQLQVAGLHNPTSLVFSDDGDLYISLYGGEILRVPMGKTQLEPDRTEVFSRGYRVPVGLAWSEDTLYISSHGMITAVRDLDHDGQPDSAREIISGLPARLYPWHANNDLVFGPDGRLYMAVGATTDASVETRQFAASILAIEPKTGSVEVFATGVRNPFDLAFNEQHDLFATDNGPDGLDVAPGDELNLILEGEDYGFPYYFEYPPPGASSQPPLALFPPHASADGLIFYEGDAFPSEYRGNAFVALFNRGEIARVVLQRQPDGSYLSRVEVFAAGFINPLDLAVGLDGDVYLIDFTPGALYRITY